MANKNVFLTLINDFSKVRVSENISLDLEAKLKLEYNKTKKTEIHKRLLSFSLCGELK